jgi:hypothetical protein
MSEKNKFVQEILNRRKSLKPENYEPKYKVGDFINNDKFKVISEILKIVNVRPNVDDKNVEYADKEVPHYIMRDYENYAAKDYFKKYNTALDMKKRKRYKECRRIDATYTIMNPDKVKILFGDRNER